VHAGSVERCYLAPKRAGLVIWPGAGALAFGLLGGVAASSLAADWTASVRTVLMPAVVGVLLAFQVGALVLARRGVAARRGEVAAAGREGEGESSAEGAGQDGEGDRGSLPRSS